MKKSDGIDGRKENRMQENMEEERAEGDVSFQKRSFRYGCYRFVKRCFDVLSSGLGLIILSPVILTCLFIKWAEDGGNPVYVSERAGKNRKDGSRGKNFKFHKIRSMCKDADKMKQDLMDRGLNEADGPVFKMKDDPRITKFGKFLRKSSIDELLQLWDIFIGKMSVVGPRPPLPKEVEQYTPYQLHRLDTKGGLLCLWQIQQNRHALSFEEWVRLDIEYIQNQSLWLDIKIIFKGAYMVFSGRSGE